MTSPRGAGGRRQSDGSEPLAPVAALLMAAGQHGGQWQQTRTRPTMGGTRAGKHPSNIEYIPYYRIWTILTIVSVCLHYIIALKKFSLFYSHIHCLVMLDFTHSLQDYFTGTGAII